MRERKYEVYVRIGLTEEQKAHIERIALKREMSQQAVMRMMMQLGIDCHKDMERVGVIKAVDFAYYVKQALKRQLEKSGRTQLNLI